MGRALVARQQGDYELGSALGRDSLSLFQELNDTWGMANALRTQALVEHAAGNDVDAEEAYGRSLDLYRQLGDRWGVASSLRSLALMAHRRADLERAQRLCQESLSVFRDLGDRRGTADALQTLGVVARAQGEHRRAAEAWQESLDLFWQAGDRLGTVQCLRLLAELAVAEGAYRRAARLFGAVEAAGTALSLDPARHARPQYEASLRAVEERMSVEEFAAGLRSGRSMTVDEAVAFALQRGS